MIGLLDIDSKLPNLVLMKLSTHYERMGERTELVKGDLDKYEKIYASCLFPWNRKECLKILKKRPDVIIGGTGWDLKYELPEGIENCRPNYDLYDENRIYDRCCKGGIATEETKIKKAKTILNMGIGFTSRGCVRSCKFCVVPIKEGKFRQVAEIKDIINTRSKVITLYDNNITADPYCIEKLNEIRDRGLTVDLTQGIDIRAVTTEKAIALSEVRHLRSLHYAWDLMPSEESVLRGVKELLKHVRPWKHMCYVLCGFNTTHEEDKYRVQRLLELGVAPYIMKFNNRNDDVWLNHFARWINGRFYKSCTFEEYKPWLKACTAA